MANDVNYFICSGRIGSDPEVRYTPSGDAITNFSVAVGSSWKDKNGEWQNHTEWVRCTAFKKLAEVIGEYYKKGTSVLVIGKFKTRTWTDRNGNERTTPEINVDQIRKLGDPKAKEDGPPTDDFSDVPF